MRSFYFLNKTSVAAVAVSVGLVAITNGCKPRKSNSAELTGGGSGSDCGFGNIKDNGKLEAAREELRKETFFLKESLRSDTPEALRNRSLTILEARNAGIAVEAQLGKCGCETSPEKEASFLKSNTNKANLGNGSVKWVKALADRGAPAEEIRSAKVNLAQLVVRTGVDGNAEGSVVLLTKLQKALEVPEGTTGEKLQIREALAVGATLEMEAAVDSDAQTEVQKVAEYTSKMLVAKESNTAGFFRDVSGKMSEPAKKITEQFANPARFEEVRKLGAENGKVVEAMRPVYEKLASPQRAAQLLEVARQAPRLGVRPAAARPAGR